MATKTTDIKDVPDDKVQEALDVAKLTPGYIRSTVTRTVTPEGKGLNTIEIVYDDGN